MINKANKFIILALIVFVVDWVEVGYATNPEDVQSYVVKQNSHIEKDGTYDNNYETSNGISAQEKGIGGEYAIGGYVYYSPERELIQLSYVADGNGFQPAGSHIPIAPPIPYPILKSLEYIRTHAKLI